LARLHRTRPPPAAALFPYTTLFRSGEAEHADALASKLPAERPHHALDHSRLALVVHLHCRADDPLIDAELVRRLQQRQRVLGEADRKSTRLNSSHLGISYAVFCLKK